MYIRFNKPIKAGEFREFWFELKLDYVGLKLGKIHYEIKAGCDYSGMVKGLLRGSSYTLPG
ncbi:MAG: hypothetical protein NTY03_02920 [Candidatus Bathyarchaeota archaeon]|jgi:hypothetical protein|nr:hypothetical protein [Candidatus Bathyarchaeota archaeon]